MWLVLCDPRDRPALWAYRELRARRPGPVEVVTPAQIVYARSEHRITSRGAETQLALADGRTIDSEMVSGVLNRMMAMPMDHLSYVAEGDRRYAVEEWTAVILSWLTCMPNVINKPHPFGLSGQFRHPAEWSLLSQEAGLTNQPYRQGLPEPTPGRHDTMIIVLDGETFGGPVPVHVAEACGRLAEMANLRLLGLRLGHGPTKEVTLVGATSTPDLRTGGTRLVEAIANSLSPHGVPA